MDYSGRELFCKRMEIGYYNGKLIHTLFHGDKKIKRRYLKQMISLNVKEFQNNAVYISDDVKYGT